MSEPGDSWFDGLGEDSLRATYDFAGSEDDARTLILAAGEQALETLKAKHADFRAKQDKSKAARDTPGPLMWSLILRQGWRRGCEVEILWSARQPKLLLVEARPSIKLDTMTEALFRWLPLAVIIIGAMVFVAAIDTHVFDIGCWEWPAYAASVMFGFLIGAFVSSWLYERIGLALVRRAIPDASRARIREMTQGVFEEVKAIVHEQLQASKPDE